MKTRLLGLLAATALSTAGISAASAADLPVRAAPPAPVIAAPIFTWTGFYLGVNAGAGWNTNSNNTVFVPGVGFVDAGGNNNDFGFVGGGQVGYNYQIGAFVIGAEADIQWADLGNNRDVFVPGVGFVGGNRNSLDWFGTVRARAGVAFDRALIYVTGGFAYGNGGNNRNCVVGNIFAGCNNDNTSTGWTVGGGVEYAFTNNLTLGIEGLYVNLDNNNNNNIFVTPAVAAFNNDNNLEFGVVRAKLNYKFGTY